MRYRLWHVGRKEYVHWPHGRMWVSKGRNNFTELRVLVHHANRYYRGTNTLRVLQIRNEDNEIVQVYPAVQI